MANRQIKVDILADEKNFTSGTSKAGASATKLSQVLAKLGPVGTVLQNVLNNIGLSSVSSAAGIAGGITAALGVSVALVEKAITRYLALAEQIRTYSAITGQSAEDSSRQVESFQEIGVTSEAAAAGMFKLARQAETAPKKLADVGIEVKRNAAGNVDLNATLLSVMAAYQGTSDAGQRAAIVYAAFGKSGAAMIPILETDRAQLKKLEDQVGKVYSAQDLEAARQYSIQQKQLGQNWNDLWNTIAGDVVPALSELTQNTLADQYANKRLTEAYQEGKISADELHNEHGKLANSYRQEYLDAQKAKYATDALVSSQQLAAQAALQEAADETALYDAMNKSIDANDKYADSVLKLQSARLQVDADAKAYDDAVNKSGANSPEAAQALETYRQAVQGLAEDYLASARAAGDKAEAERIAAGGAMDTAEKTDIERVALEKIRDTLSPNDPLRKNLQNYIDQMNSVPKQINTAFTNTFLTSGRAGGNIASFDDGGVVPGAPGAPMPAIVHGGEVVLNKDQQKAMGGHTFSTTIHINGAQDPGAIAREVARRMRDLSTP